MLGSGRTRVIKVPTTPDQAEGFLTAFRRATDGLPHPEQVLHGTTVATNAVLERRGARLAFLGTEGFASLLHLARQDRPRLYDLRARRPAPLADAALCVDVPERIGPDGEVVKALDEDRLRESLRVLRGAVEAVAIALLHSYANPAHERRAADIAAEELPGCEISASIDVLPEFREYERASTTALNAYVQPAVSGYLRRLQGAAGVSSLAVMRSGGGLRSVAEAARRPVHMLLSGPAAGVLASAWVARLTGFRDVVTLDMGGTSADVAIIDDASPLIAEEAELDGLPFRTPCIDVISVGAGGGSVAWVDEGGALRAGPHSAGATPGPVCYGRGGTEPTVTDAHLVLGHLGPEGLAGGELALDVGAARRSLSKLAERAGMDTGGAAAGTLTVVQATMTRAVRSVSVERGKDVRRYALVAFGGAGPLHGTAVARQLGISTVIVPPSPGALAALGLLVARLRADVSRSYPLDADDACDPTVDDLLDTLERQARDELAGEGVDPSECEVHRVVDCRYRGQSHELRVEVQAGWRLADVRAAFHEAHRIRYGFSRHDAGVEVITFRAAALGPQPSIALPEPPKGGAPQAAGVRRVMDTDVAVYRRQDLPAGWLADGPVIIVETDSTTWVEPGCSVEVHPTGVLVIAT